MTTVPSISTRGHYAILGGAFDPVHAGHLNIAIHLQRMEYISAVVFVPVRNHNFKGNSITLDWESRYSLIERILEPGMLIWDCDSNATGYTSDLMKGLRQDHPDKSFLFVIGADNIQGLPGWHDASWLRDNTRFLAVCRPGYPTVDAMPRGFDITFAEIPPMEVSSTDIRKRIAAGQSISGLVPESIEAEVTRLYKEAGRQ